MPLDTVQAIIYSEIEVNLGKPLHELPVADIRAVWEEMFAYVGEGPEMLSVSNEKVVTATGAFDIRILLPAADPRGIIVFYHGGGWIAGTIDEHDTLGRMLANQTGCAVVLVDYRLAPEHPYPAAANDAYDALCWVAENKQGIAGKEVPLLVAGESSGGNLAVVTALRTRDLNGPAIAMQIVVCPIMDTDFTTASYLAPENQRLLTSEVMVRLWNDYVPDPDDRTQVYAAPLRAGDFSGLPAAVILTAGFDPLCDEGEAYAAALVQQGIPVVFKRYTHLTHGFFALPNVLPACDESIAFVAAAIDMQLRLAITDTTN
ncbi:alpha/beta hydrolase [Chitinophaga nivalis]|uniref:Alpha/beta hydrolase n=1 Tax=Chitinophaga nivalis TaxID=2991709 RepID=A0ABT3IMX0_9BACT|nr:alpha/beta hydrolase [Chitinophaga nivalis]MCW3464998.1 alpha/beta hydrolase [Chitinophaga nivalis]MCW3485310.1 alpha/beta hydrolase [Chitinophaga nivalis]